MDTERPDPTAERRDEVVKRMLATPPQKHTPKKTREDLPRAPDGRISSAGAPTNYSG